jgi:hypothetical protein
MNALSEWLQLMLAEIARKQDDSERARAEEARRGRAPVTDTRQRASRGRLVSENFPLPPDNLTTPNSVC